MKKHIILILIFSIVAVMCVGSVLANIERKMVASAEDVADWMTSTARKYGWQINVQEAQRAAEIIVQLSRMEGGKQMLTDPQILTDQLNNNGVSDGEIVKISIQAAQALQQPELGGLSVREIVTMSPSVAVRQYPEIIGGELMLRGSSIKLAEAQQIVEVLQNMITVDPSAFDNHVTDIKMKLIKEWGVEPAFADIAVKVVGTSQEKMEVIVPSNAFLAGGEAEIKKRWLKEAFKYLQSRGRMDEADGLKWSMRNKEADFQLSDVADKRGKATVANLLELGIAIHFLETIHPDGADFVKAMAAEERFGSMGLQQYIALVKKEMSHEWINIVNRNSLGHIALGDINQQIRKYENDLKQYAEFGGGKISITSLARDYIQVGDREMPYDLVSLMAKEPIYPGQLRMAFEVLGSSLEPTQIEAIDALSKYLPEGIRGVLEEAGSLINMKPYEIEETIRDLAVFRVRAASVEDIEESRGLLDQQQAFLIYMIMNRPRAVAWLSQVASPVKEGDAKIVINDVIRKALAEFSGIPVVEFGYAEKMNVLFPEKGRVNVYEYDEQMASRFTDGNINPVYVASSYAELAALQEKAFMLPLYADLRKRKAAKFNIASLSSIEKALKAADNVTASHGIHLENMKWAIIPTQFEELAVVSISKDDYKAIEERQQKAKKIPDDGSDIYFLKGDGSFFKFLESRDILGRREKRKLDVSELQNRIYLGDAVIFAASEFIIDRLTAFELFGNNNYFKHRGGLVCFNDPYLVKPEKDNLLAAIDILDAEMSSVFDIKKESTKNSWKVLDGVRISDARDNTATLIYISGGFFQDEKYILEVSSDLARNPTLIKIRLRDMTIEQALQEETVQGTSSLATGILESFDPSVKETTKDKVVKWAASKFRNRTEGSSLKGIRIKKLSFAGGMDFLNEEFPKEIEIGRLADLTEEIVNIKGADRIRKVISQTRKMDQR